MELVRRILNYGINKTTGLKETERIRNQNNFSLIVVFILLLLGIIDFFFSPTLVTIIHFGSILMFILSMIFLPKHRFSSVGSIIQLSILAFNVLVHYFLVPEISLAVLFFILIFPSACISLLHKKGIWISLALLSFTIIGNYIPITDLFEPLSLSNLIIFSLAYISLAFVFFSLNLDLNRKIDEQIEKVDYYEAEIKQRDEFITNLSHKLRTSLSNITLINNLVHDSRMSTAQKELLDTLKSSTYDLINDVNDLVEIATPSVIDFKQSILSFNLTEALKGITSILHSNNEFKTELILSGDDELDYNIIGDPSMLRSVLINLIKGLGESDLIDKEIHLQVLKDYETQNTYGLKFILVFNARNAGILKTTLNNISAKAESQSPFITNAHRLLELNATKPEFGQIEDKQSLFFFLDFSKDLTKPLKKSIEEDLQEIKTGSKKNLSECTLLLVEDNAINQKIVLLSLSKLVKHIDVANNGKEALDMFGLKKYDIILMDIQMPVMDGITATKKIREIETTSDDRIPVIAITANALAGDRDNCLAAGVDEYISKPFQVDDLINKINILLD